jgi:hypothetical protein
MAVTAPKAPQGGWDGWPLHGMISFFSLLLLYYQLTVMIVW